MAFAEAKAPDAALTLRLAYRLVSDGRLTSLALNKNRGAVTVYLVRRGDIQPLALDGSAEWLLRRLRRGESLEAVDRFESVAAMLLGIVARGMEQDRFEHFEVKRISKWFGLHVRFAAFLGDHQNVAHVALDRRHGYEAIAHLVNDMKDLIAPLPTPEDFIL